MASIEDHQEELQSVSREILKQLDKLPITHGDARLQVWSKINIKKYKFIKNRIAKGKQTLRHLKLEIRGLPEEKQSKWKEVIIIV